MPPPYHFGPAHPVVELGTSDRADNPTLTSDLLEIFFTSTRDSGHGDIWTARRAAAELPFDPPTPATELNTSSVETSTAISADGLTLWFGSERSGGVGGADIWVSTRPSRSVGWSTPVNVVDLNTPDDDIPRPPGEHEMVMPLASTEAGHGIYRTYFARRAGRGSPFGTPVAVKELNHDDRSTVDGFLSDDGLTLLFSSTPSDSSAVDGGSDGGVEGKGDLFAAWRRSVDETFTVTQPLDDLNTAGDERDPWLTPDGKTLYFTSDRDGELAIYTAAVLPR